MYSLSYNILIPSIVYNNQYVVVLLSISQPPSEKLIDAYANELNAWPRVVLDWAGLGCGFGFGTVYIVVTQAQLGVTGLC